MELSGPDITSAGNGGELQAVIGGRQDMMRLDRLRIIGMNEVDESPSEIPIQKRIGMFSDGVDSTRCGEL